jgi:hypothetical protein
METGLLYLDDRDIATDFSLALASFSGWPGMLGGSPREVPLLNGPEMMGAILDSRLIRRQQTRATIGALLITDSVALALTALDALKGLLGQGEVAVRSVYAPTRECLAVCDAFEVQPYTGEEVSGRYTVTLGFTLKDGVSQETTPDGYALSTTAVECPIGTAESRPIITIDGNGSALTNPTVTVRDIAGDIVQTMGFTVSLGATDVLRIDCARAQVSKIVGAVTTDGLAAGYWVSGDFLTLKPEDALVELAQYPTVELSSDTGTAVGTIAYSRKYL